jgi:hypothetical protein
VIGNTTVTYTASDGVQPNTTCAFIVTLSDTLEVVISNCPSDTVIPNIAGQCYAVVNWTEPTAFDNCGLAHFANETTISPGDTMPVYPAYAVKYLAIANDGTRDSCEFNIEVKDTEVPQVTGCPSDITDFTLAGSCGNTIVWTPPNFTDNCNIDTVTANFNPGTAFSAGNTAVIYTAIDDWGNSTQCDFNVTLDDPEDPVISNCPENIRSCSPVTAWVPPTANDNCNVASFTRNISISTTMTHILRQISYVATDNFGNSTSCNFSISQNSLPVANAGTDTTLTAGDTVALGGGIAGFGGVETGTGGAAPYLYFWSPITNLNSGTVANPLAYPASTTTFTVFVIDSNGCAATDQVQVTINSPVVIEDGEKNEVGLIEAANFIVDIFPNPTSEFANVKIELVGDVPKPVVIEIYSILGRQLYSWSSDIYESLLHRLDLEKFISGHYYLKVKIGGDEITRKIVVVK